jgi:hypothetical protein
MSNYHELIHLQESRPTMHSLMVGWLSSVVYTDTVSSIFSFEKMPIDGHRPDGDLDIPYPTAVTAVPADVDVSQLSLKGLITFPQRVGLKN